MTKERKELIFGWTVGIVFFGLIVVLAYFAQQPTTTKSPSEYHADQCSEYASTAFVPNTSGWQAAFDRCNEQ